MFDIFKRKTPKEQLRENIRSLTKAQRELDNERIKLEQQEKKVLASIKTAAVKGQTGACKIMAMDLVKTRRNVKKLYTAKTQLQAIQLQIRTFASTLEMTEAMKGVTSTLRSMNKSVNLPKISSILQDFEMQSETMDMKQEMIEDAMDDEEAEDEEEGLEILAMVLDEIGIGINQTLGKMPIAEKETDTLQLRLDSLRKE